MRLTRKFAVALAITGTVGMASTAVNAAAAHCPDGLGKVELVGDSASVQTDLAPGTEVCIKAGNSITNVTVNADGSITNDGIFNQNGNARGISYYVWYTSTPSS